MIRVGIDIDGFLTDIATFQLERGKNYFKEIKNPNGYSIRDIFGCSKFQEKMFWIKNMNYYSLKARENASYFTHYLHSIGVEVYIITSRAFSHKNNPIGIFMRHGVRTWLLNNDIYYDTIIYCDEDKVKTIKKYKINYMGEDSPINAKEISKYIPVLLMNAPYNQDLNDKNIYLINNFLDATILFNKLAKIKPQKKK